MIPISNTRSVAELTIAEIVALHRRLLERSNDLHEGRWRKSAQGSNEIRGRTLGIVGYGHIGSQLSVLAEAMGMRVLYHDVAPKMAIGNARSSASLTQLLRECDVISVHVPDTPTTKGLFGTETFATMRQGAIFINNARGSVVKHPSNVDRERFFINVSSLVKVCDHRDHWSIPIYTVSIHVISGFFPRMVTN